MDIKRVDILGQKYKVVKKARGITPEEAENYYGLCFRDKNLIWVNPKLSSEHQYRTLFHEMGHATMYRSGVSFSGAIPMELEEILVEVFASQQYEFMRSFIKDLVKYEPGYIKKMLKEFLD